MLITFLRHATAEDSSLSVPDADRALIDKGEKQVKRVAAFCLANGLIPGSIYCSPLLRAQQTARILNQRLPGSPAPQTADWLGIDTSAPTILTELAKLAEQGLDDVWLVGHEPDFSITVSRLLGTVPDNIVIKKASLTRLDADLSDQASAKLLWSVPCSLMR
ncbi:MULTISPECIES: SixA phosphatase family protein [Methylomonas]|uniref:Histidine phosphatase family protein n=2 Tax=Methylomonas TaxID=416 RepID=A0A126T6B3_9GAMM|nr:MULTISPECIES: histidine phosphatase family protein [Methylomonas]AMK77606.1 histidine phosphatase family protein [Methylomonas denitrificans]OAI05183.1 histidine phosphatase family protein [Methylomonas methanica]TCV84349.1 phosphohistidine phosphatase SixA [Methylomonas methanica]